METETLQGTVGIIGTLSLSGVSFRYQLTKNDMKKPIFKRWNASKLNLNPGKWLLDDAATFPIDIHCLIIAEGTAKKMLICLCLVQDEREPDKWRRMGLCHWDGLLWQVSKYAGRQPVEEVFQIV